MTLARRQRKSRTGPPAAKRARNLLRVALRRIGLAILLAVAAPGFASVRAATTERVVNDVLTGLAMNGVDPVAYFSDGLPVYGSPQYEYRYAGVTWRFCNQGNKAAFAARPDVYMPRYGGYDPVALGRDRAVPGNPLFWIIVSERIYLFYDEAARKSFLSNPGNAIALADSKWPAVYDGLVP